MSSFTENQFYDLLALKLSGDATKEQLQLLQKQLQLNPQWQFLYDQMLRPSATYSDDITAQAFAAHAVKMQLKGEMNGNGIYQENEKPAKGVYRKLILGLAIAASSIGILFFVFRSSDSVSQKKSANEVVTKRGSKSFIKLPDGTQVWLNADSKLTYIEGFGDKTREVNLNGEAFFDVFHDAAHPFIIHTGKADIRVLGTAFNIKNYWQDESMEATLIRGKIEVTLSDRPDEKIIMHPQEKIIIFKTLPTTVKSITKRSVQTAPLNRVILTSLTMKDSLVAETSWVKDKMVFVNEPLQKIAEEIERKFAISIVFKNEKAREYRYTGIFEKESVEEIFHIIRLSKKINFFYTNKILTIE